MSNTCPIVHVKNSDSPDGFIVINESDFDASKHERVVPLPPAVVVPAPPAPPADALDSLAANWREQDYGSLRDFVVSLTGRSVDNQAQAVQVIDELLAARAAK